MSKTWFVTGASRGIGAEIVKAALVAGDSVVATGRDLPRLERLFVPYGDRVLSLQLDVTEESQAVAAVEAAVQRFGHIDVVVNNAGYGQLGPFEENDAEAAERQFATNVFGLFHVCRAVLPVMRRQRAGHIFNVSSIAGVAGMGGAALYCSAKFAVEGFSESLAQEVAQFGIHVTIVEPGAFRTDFLDASSAAVGGRGLEDYAEFSKKIKASSEANNHKQLGDPARLGAMLVRLAAKEKPPLRYLAGSDALQVATGKLAAISREIEQWRDHSVLTDGDSG
ncbi:oxidoreductase [Pseudomonas sp. NPDC077186]|uniref:oxidoreductase n=1 Tax=Pseudomonadaceae TaxID=135621 RepID=UPI00027871B4|nr:oxidoreductase [Pseudomonas hydrolytica]EJO93249.1 short-chain dehydrogenase reductase sdr [Pseudomonas mendocina DLHK]MBF8161618.1 SDR family NAD(P)-dependent oxidoreductase [Pseudomonas mendocina]UTH33894.1 oxidoreductase [Pseudomonas hydrolytica]UZZ13164.1 oxidoreductase [Pseudomonas mendocina]